MRLGTATALVALVVCTACGNEPGPPSGSDAGVRGDAATAPTPAAPALPVLTPCPVGWRELTSSTGLVTCDPFPEGGPAPSCPAGQAHFAGEPGCAVIGPACPAGEFPEGLPSDRAVLYVRAGAAAGDGSRALPFGTIGEAASRAAAGTIVAIAKGTYDESIRLFRGVTLWGACAAETIVAPSRATTLPAAITPIADAEVRALTIRPVVAAPGLWVDGAGAALTLDGVIVENAASTAVLVAERARLVARSLVVRSTRSDASGRLGYGMEIYAATCEVTHSVIEHSRSVGVRVSMLGAEARLDGVVIRATASTPAVEGRGISVEYEGIAELRRSAVYDNGGMAAVVANAGTVLRMEDVAIRGQPDAAPGWALSVEPGAAAEVRRTLIEDTREVAVRASGEGTTLLLENVVVRGVAPAADGARGVGVGVDDTASAELRAVAIERSHVAGLLAIDSGTHVLASDLSVRDTESEVSTGLFGRAITVQTGATVEVHRGRFERSREVAISASGSSTVTLEDVVVADTLPRACAATTCVDSGAGVGVGTYGGAIVLTRFAIARSALCGVQIALDGSLDLHEGEVSENEIGACVQVAGYDLARLNDRVRYRDNGASLLATSLPTPDVSVSLR